MQAFLRRNGRKWEEIKGFFAAECVNSEKKRLPITERRDNRERLQGWKIKLAV